MSLQDNDCVLHDACGYDDLDRHVFVVRLGRVYGEPIVEPVICWVLLIFEMNSRTFAQTIT